MSRMVYRGNVRFGVMYPVSGPPPIPAPSGSLTFDDFNSYTALDLLNGLNSGSNEWDNITSLAAYFSREAFIGIKEWDDFNYYTTGTSLSASMPGSGSEEWSGSYDYYGRESFISIKATDTFDTYTLGTSISGSNAGSGSNLWGWGGAWDTREQDFLWGIKVFDNFSTYTVGLTISGSGGAPYAKWNNTWTGNWDNRLNISGSV